ncbi:MAG: MFS transporter [Candidatus Solibacter usitatus]|nr:MFS transporter [Candidatus Solibacter usitatus]
MLIVAAILAIFVYGMIAAMLGTVLPDFSKRFSLTPKQNGNIAMSQAIGLMIGSFFIGPLVDTQGVRVGLLLGLGLISLALFGLRTAQSGAVIAGMMMLLGTGGGCIVTAANTLPPHIKMEALTTAGVYNLLNLFFGLGGLVTPLIAASLFKNNSNKLLLFAGSLCLVTFVDHAATEMPPAAGKVGFQVSSVTELLSQGSLLAIALVLFVYVAAEVGVWNWLTRHLIAQGVDEKKALTILSLGFALGLLLGRVAISPMLGNIKPEQALIGASVLMAITTFLIAQSTKPSVAWGLVFLAGVAMAPVFPTALAIVGTKFPDKAATAIGIAVTAGWFGLVVSSPIIGGIAGDDPKRLKKALLVLPACSVIMLLAALAL